MLAVRKSNRLSPNLLTHKYEVLLISTLIDPCTKRNEKIAQLPRLVVKARVMLNQQSTLAGFKQLQSPSSTEFLKGNERMPRGLGMSFTLPPESTFGNLRFIPT